MVVIVLAFGVVVVVVVVAVAMTGEVEHAEADAGGNQHAADDRVLGVLDGRAEPQSNRDDHGAKDDRDEDVRDSGQSGEPRDARERVAAGAAKDRERHPVVGQDRMTETDACGRSKQRRTCAGHRAMASCMGLAASPRRRCSVCEIASLSNARMWSSCSA